MLPKSQQFFTWAWLNRIVAHSQYEAADVESYNAEVVNLCTLFAKKKMPLSLCWNKNPSAHFFKTNADKADDAFMTF